MRHRRPGRVRVLLLLAFAMACHAGSDTAPPKSTLASADARWCTGAPFMRIGEGPATGGAPLLDRVIGAHRFEDGRLVVANAGSSSLLFFDATGGFEQSAGRAGEGPGEFRQISSLGAYRGDSLLVYDGALQRVSVFDAHGALARSYSMPPVSGTPSVRAVLGSGATVIEVATGFQSDTTGTGVYRPELTLMLLDPDGAVLRDLGRFPGRASFVLSSADGMMVGPLVFGPTLQLAVVGGAIIAGATDSDTVQAMMDSTVGRLAVPFQRRPATGADFDEAMNEYLARVPPPMRAFERRRFDVMPRVDSLPVFAELFGDAQGRLWMREELGPRDGRRHWEVVSPTGGRLASARLPDGSQVLEVGSEWAIVNQRDSLDVEQVQVLPIQRTGCAADTPAP